MFDLTHQPGLKIFIVVGVLFSGFLIGGYGLSRAASTTENQPVYRSTMEEARAYQGPGEAYPLLAIYTQGITLTVTGRSEDSGWLQVNISPYLSGWMKAETLSQPGKAVDLPLAATPNRLVTVTPEARPALVITLGPALGKIAGGKSSPGILITVITAAPHTRVSLLVLGVNNKSLWNGSCPTDANGVCEKTYSSQLMTRGTYTVKATDEAGHSVSAQITLEWGKEPTPKPGKDK